MAKIKLRLLTDEQFKKAPIRIRIAHLKARTGTFDIHSSEADSLIKEFPNYFVRENGWPAKNNPFSVIWKAVVYVWNEILGNNTIEVYRKDVSAMTSVEKRQYKAFLDRNGIYDEEIHGNK